MKRFDRITSILIQLQSKRLISAREILSAPSTLTHVLAAKKKANDAGSAMTFP